MKTTRLFPHWAGLFRFEQTGDIYFHSLSLTHSLSIYIYRVAGFWNEHRTSSNVRALSVLPFISSMVLICARFWKLLLASRITQARLSNKLDSWILRHPWVTSSRKLWQAIVAVTGALLAVEVVLGVASPVCSRSGAVFVWTSLLMVTYWLVVAALTWRLRRLQDGFFVVHELKMLGAVIFVSNVVLILMIGEAGGRPPPIPVIVSSVLQLIIQTWYPLWKSFTMAPGLQAGGDAGDALPSVSSVALSQMSATKKSGVWTAALSADSSLVEILRHPVGFEAMKRFLTLEFSVENLLCWQQLHENKRERRPGQVQAHFNAVFETFVRNGSPNEVNISSQLKVGLAARSLARSRFNGSTTTGALRERDSRAADQSRARHEDEGAETGARRWPTRCRHRYQAASAEAAASR